MRRRCEFSAETSDAGAQTLALSGPLTVSTAGLLEGDLRRAAGSYAAIDLSQVSAIDTVGAWLAFRLADDHQARIVGASDQAQRLIAAVGGQRSEAAVRPHRARPLRRVLDSIGNYVAGSGSGMLAFLGFMGQMILAVGSLVRHPRRFRFKALVHQMELVGVSALGIIGLMSFLVGIVIAQQGAVQLKQFGAEIYTINLTGRISFRELGVLMTAIMVAGRSGSAFAAQIGTMKLTEEVDAMRTIGVSPVEALVIPRVLASTLMMLLLGFYASLCAILGGATISTLTLEIPFMTFLSRIQEVVPMHDIYVGMVKAPVFGAIVALSGCYQGMQVEGNSEEVGLRTTIAVVQAIFAVIVLDAFFAVFFTEVGWG
ncbi:MlaE family lipid ABC transporter permease subunit [Novosphingobium sp.]|uniref:ABC transporter permease n=1 Tax=Novosphingobium sp. TaxID=1874826 RepID=UPI0025CBE9A2|nr:MlaE family lipid ABC transporter permease subunit [Novosphingobium sp.]